MINRLNLASDPFRNRTVPWVISALILIVSIFSFVILYAQWGEAKTQAEMIKSGTLAVEEDLKKYQDEEEKVRQQLTPEQQQLLLAAHKLVMRKEFSWSRLFSDLENVLPGGVSVSHINVEDVTSNGGRTEAQLDLGVLSRDHRNVIGMIDNMNSSGIFHAELRGQDRQKSDSGDYTQFTLHLTYLPRIGVPVQQVETSRASNSTQEVK